MNNKLTPEHLAIKKDKYRNEKDFFEAVGRLLDILTTNDYEVLFRHEDCGVYPVEFAYDPYHTPDYGADRFVRVTEDEEEQVWTLRESSEEHETEEA